MTSEIKCIYFIFFFESLMGYVGQTKNFVRRMKEHQSKNSGCRYLKHAIGFYGFEGCSVHILEDDLTIEEANKLEKIYIRELGTLVPNGYNLNEGGGSFEMQQETKDLMSKSAIERWKDPEFREKQLEILRTDEYRQKMSEVLKKRWEDEEYRQKMSQKMKEKWEDEEYRQKVEIGIAEYWSIEENIERARERTTTLWQDTEFRKKTSEASRLASNTPEMKEKRKINAEKLWKDEEFRKKQTQTRKLAEFSEKMSKAVNSEDNLQRKARIRQEKSERCRELFVRFLGDKKKVAEEMKVIIETVSEYMRPYKDDKDIIELKKQHFKSVHNTPEMKEKKKKAAAASRASKQKQKLSRPE